MKYSNLINQNVKYLATFCKNFFPLNKSHLVREVKYCTPGQHTLALTVETIWNQLDLGAFENGAELTW